MYHDIENVVCPNCDTEFYAWDHEVPYPSPEEIRANELHRRNIQANNLWILRTSAPEIYRETRANWWSARAYRQISKKTREWATKELLSMAKPTTLFQKFVGGG
jgi:hypothetical protein